MQHCSGRKRNAEEESQVFLTITWDESDFSIFLFCAQTSGCLPELYFQISMDVCFTQEGLSLFVLYFSEQEQLVERLAGEISKHKKELKLMKNEKKRSKQSENKTTQADEERTKLIHTDRQVNKAYNVVNFAG